MQDRIPLHPGRVRLTPVPGQENTFDMVLADEPQTEGTPLNKATLLTDSTAQSILKQMTRDSIKLGDLALGDEIRIPVDGTLNAFFRVVHQGNPDPSFYDASCDGTWLMLISEGNSHRWDENASGSYTGNNDYSAGVHTWLNEVWIDTLEESALNFVKTVKIPYRPGASYTSTTVASGADGLSARAFLPSTRELGGYTNGSDSYRISDGKKLDYFDQAAANDSSDPSNGKRTFNIRYWTRTPAYYNSTYQSVDICVEGYVGTTGVTAQHYMQPIIIMDADAYQWPDGTFHDAAQESGINVDTVNDALSVLSMAAGRAQNYWLITTTRDWVVPATGKYQITCFGGGGGGAAGSYSNQVYYRGQGGGAGYLAQAIVSLIKHDIYRITIGLGGKRGQAGQATSFGTLVTANGGGAGTYSAPGQGSAAGGQDNYSLGYLTGYAGNIGAGSYSGSGGGGGFFGVGGNGGAGHANSTGMGSIFATSGQNGTGFASGGGGGGSGGTLAPSTSGGIGAPGVCIIELLNAEEMP